MSCHRQYAQKPCPSRSGTVFQQMAPVKPGGFQGWQVVGVHEQESWASSRCQVGIITSSLTTRQDCEAVLGLISTKVS